MNKTLIKENQKLKNSLTHCPMLNITDFFVNDTNKNISESYMKKRKIINIKYVDDAFPFVWAIAILLTITMGLLLCIQTFLRFLLPKKLDMRFQKSIITLQMRNMVVVILSILSGIVGIYFLISLNEDPKKNKNFIEYNFNLALHRGSIQKYSPTYKLDWDNYDLFTTDLSTVSLEDKQRNIKINNIFKNMRKVNENISFLKYTLKEKPKSYFDYVASSPDVNGIEEIKIPIFQKLGSEDFNFFKKTNNSIDEFVTQLQSKEKVGENIKRMGFFDDKILDDFRGYNNRRINFFLQFSFYGQNIKKMIREYFEDKEKIYEELDLDFTIIVGLSLLITLIHTLILGFGIQKLKYFMLVAWIPLVYLTYVSIMSISDMHSLGYTLQTECVKINANRNNFMMNSESLKLIREIIPRNNVQISYDGIDDNLDFIESLNLCANDGFFFSKKEFQILSKKIDTLGGIWIDYLDSFEFDAKIDYSQLENYSKELNKTWVTFDSPFFNKKGPMYKSLFALQNYSSYSYTNSIQKNEGRCSVSQDEWVIKDTDCLSLQLKKKGRLNQTAEQMQFNFGNKTCLNIFDFTSKEIAFRYSLDNFKSCNKLIEKKINIEYHQFLISFHNKTKSFFEKTKTQLNSANEYFKNSTQTAKDINEATENMRHELNKEENLIYKLMRIKVKLGQKNNCNFVKKSVNDFYNYFCRAEMYSFDKKFEYLAIIPFALLLIVLLVGISHNFFYSNFDQLKTISAVEYEQFELESIGGQQSDNIVRIILLLA